MMARRERMCAAPECNRRAESGSMVCADHRWTALGAETDRQIVQLTRRLAAMSKVEDAEKRRESAMTFREQVTRGEYSALQSANMLQMLSDSGGGVDLSREIGMLRIAMLRVLTEEEQPSRMAHALAKLSFAVGRTMKLQDEWNGKDAQDRSLAELLEEILIEVEEDDRELREPWIVDPYNPSPKMIQALGTAGVLPGTQESVAWMMRWRLDRTRELAEKGDRTAQLMLSNGDVATGWVLGEGN